MSFEAIHKSLHRPKLVLGVDRELGMGACVITGITAFSGPNIPSLVSAVAFWFVSIYYLRKWAKKDPQMRDVFLRFIGKGQIHYSARPGAFSDGRVGCWKKGWFK